MQASDIIVGGVAVGGAILMRENGVTPEWVSHAIAACTGSGLAAGFRFLDGQVKGVAAAILAFTAGTSGGYYAGSAIVTALKLEHELAIPLTFFCATVGAAIVRSLSTRMSFDAAVDALRNKINNKISGEK